MLLIAEPLIIVWVGAEYSAAFIPLAILAATTPLGIGQNSAIQVFYAMSKHRYYAYLNITEAAFNLAISLLLVKEYGIVGVALGTAIPFVISKLIFVPHLICKFTEIPLKEYMFNLVKPIILILFLESGCLGLISYFKLDNFWQVFALASFWQILIGIILLKFIASKDDYAYAMDTVPIIGKILRRQE
ncbi:MAG: polysaccharide biosynthesis protein [Kordiimonadaceae bacterium]|nr:polysaccharide biosynthesis protein [Kordiimonadaceae bacterium]MBT6036570.1 polysaccharide biosynthesis protein [Kordiimonadaceae bacterium]MBT6330031.1 polysaccharide biosynthesis protein [Kordiimonadaceae bacterium]MBT7583171.1 polysaccharide biosynthesis protein [Kordiimonadaceae bacterium]